MVSSRSTGAGARFGVVSMPTTGSLVPDERCQMLSALARVLTSTSRRRHFFLSPGRFAIQSSVQVGALTSLNKSGHPPSYHLHIFVGAERGAPAHLRRGCQRIAFAR